VYILLYCATTQPYTVTVTIQLQTDTKGKCKVHPYLLTSDGPGADPGVQAVNPQMTLSHPSGSRLPLLSARPVVTFPAKEHHCPSAGSKLYCLVTEAHACEQVACQLPIRKVNQQRFEPMTFWIMSKCSTITPHTPLHTVLYRQY